MKKAFFLPLILLFCGLMFGSVLSAQESDSASNLAVPQKDLIDVLHAVLKRKPSTNAEPDKVSVPRLHLSVVPAVGYTLQNGFAASLSANASFLNAGSQTQNLSVVNSSVSVTQKNQFTVVLQSNLWSGQNKMNWVGDDRFLIYPQATYGLGGHTKLFDENLVNYNLIRLSQAVYFKIKNYIYAGFGYNLNYHYRISETAQTKQADDDIAIYDETDENPVATVTYPTVSSKLPRTVSSGLSANFLVDQRRNPNNPVAGARYINVQLLNNLQLLGSDDDWQSLVVDARKYIGLGKQSNKLALWAYGWFTFNDHAPYLDLPSTGWDAAGNLGRGYVQGRFRGKNLLYAEAEYRMTFTRNGLLGGVFFANTQTVSDWPSNRFTTLHPAVGTGIRLKFNKHSNTNIALDYAVGTGGSKGVFVNLGEVF